MDWRDLQRNLPAASLYLVYGEDEWQITQVLRELKKMIPVSLRQMNLYHIDGRKLKPTDLQNYRQVSLFGEERLLIIDEPSFLRSARRGEDSSSSSSRDENEESLWQRALSEMQDELPVVIVHPGSLDKRRRMWKWLDKEALLVECNPLKRSAMLSFIQEQLRAEGFTAGYGVAETIQEIAGEAPGIVVQEISKLRTAYPDLSRLTAEDAERVLSESIDAKVYLLIDLLTESKLADAFDLVDELLRRGESVPRILSSLAGQVRQMIQVLSLQKSKQNNTAIARTLGLHAFHVQRLAEKGSLFHEEELRELLSICCQSDSRMKSGRLGMESGLNLMLLRVSASLKRGRLVQS
ncbi:MAG: DNA polymerase III subunit delta [Symbiobacteriaceae bacterium]|nr:DNA polymerase III subunit delta [Symbiobacteriaceae bacterium]